MRAKEGLNRGLKCSLLMPDTIEVRLPQSNHSIMSCSSQSHSTHIPLHLPHLESSTKFIKEHLRIPNIQLYSMFRHHYFFPMAKSFITITCLHSAQNFYVKETRSKILIYFKEGPKNAIITNQFKFRNHNNIEKQI